MSEKDEWVWGQAVNEKERRERRQRRGDQGGEEERKRIDRDGVAGAKRDR